MLFENQRHGLEGKETKMFENELDDRFESTLTLYYIEYILL